MSALRHALAELRYSLPTPDVAEPATQLELGLFWADFVRAMDDMGGYATEAHELSAGQSEFNAAQAEKARAA